MVGEIHQTSDDQENSSPPGKNSQAIVNSCHAINLCEARRYMLSGHVGLVCMSKTGQILTDCD